MAKTESRIAFLQTTDAEFRTWVAAVIADLTTLLTQTADTGQINTATVTKPAAANAVQGYTMWHLNDGLSPTLYIKIEFGSGSQGSANPAMFFTAGFATDGAGTLTGTDVSPRYRNRLTNTNAGLTAYLRMCKVGSCFVCAWNAESVTAQAWTIIVDRYRTATTGVANNTGANIINVADTESNSSSGGGTNIWNTALPAGGAPYEVGGNGVIGPFYWSISASWSRGSRLGVGSICCWDGGATQPTIGGVTITNTDCPTHTTFSASIYGTSYVFRATAISTIVNSGSVGNLAHIWQ